MLALCLGERSFIVGHAVTLSAATTLTLLLTLNR